MGHNIYTSVYDENVNKSAVENKLNHLAALEGQQEGSSGLSSPIRWIDHICEDYDEAEAYIESHDSGWYDQLAVKFRDYKDIKTTKTYEVLKERAFRLYQNYNKLKSNIHYKDAKSEFIGCKQCGSKLARKYIRSNTCPMCKSDLRPASTLKCIENARKAYEKASKELNEEERKLKAKQKNQSKIKWLVKIEYHT